MRVSVILDYSLSIFSEDDFMIEAPSIGTLQRVRIGHNNAGIAPGWFLEKLTVEDVATNTVSEFKVSRWLAKNEDDGKIVRDLYTDEKFSLDSSEGGLLIQVDYCQAPIIN